MSNSLSMQPATILIVDDDDETRSLFRLMLARLNAGTHSSHFSVSVRFLEAATGQQALAIAEAERPDVILLDLMLPDLSGLDAGTHFSVCAHMRRLPACRTCKIVMVTAMLNRREASTAAGADDFWSKPVGPQKLRNGVLSLLRGGLPAPA